MISVVIRTKNSARTLRPLLRSLGQEGDDEVIIVDSGSTDETLEIAAGAGAKVLRLETPFHYSIALNQGFSAARCDWVLSLSSHCVPLDGPLLPQYRRALDFQRPELAVVYGSMHLSRRKSLRAELSWVTPESFSKVPGVPGGNGNALYRRSLWGQKPFTLELPTAEDLEWFLWALRTGYHALSFPAASVVYRNQSTPGRMFQKGMLETRVSHALLGGRPAGPREIILGFGTLLKKTMMGELPLDATVRQLAHRSGAIYGSWLSPWHSPGS